MPYRMTLSVRHRAIEVHYYYYYSSDRLCKFGCYLERSGDILKLYPAIEGQTVTKSPMQHYS